MFQGYKALCEKLGWILGALTLAIAISSCTPASLKNAFSFEKRPTEKPAFSEENIEKSFFVDPNGKAKTFLCGWAAERSSGELGEQWLTQLRHNSAHCNIQFEITKDFLIGKMINPSFPTNPEKWSPAIQIPISKHYYYEKRRDEYGRDTNVFIENSERSDWSARPMMKLDLKGLSIENWAYAIDTDDSRTPSITAIKDVEWDKKTNFLGFSADITSAYYGSAVQASIRFNFLKFEHNPNFKRIPYSQTNAKFFNALHVMGRMIEDYEPDMWVARWDLSRTTNLYIDNVPEKYQKVILDAVENWNTTLQEIEASPKGIKAFKPILSQMKHPFDLRYPAIHWISDKRVSANSPLGIGQSHADVANGQVLYGLVVLWGGILDEYMRSYTPTSSAAANSLSKFPLADNYSAIPASLALPFELGGIANTKSQMAANLRRESFDFLLVGKSTLENYQKELSRKDISSERRQQLTSDIATLEHQLAQLQQNPAITNEMAEVANNFAAEMQTKTSAIFGESTLLEVLGLVERQPVQIEKKNESAQHKHLAHLKNAEKNGRDFTTKIAPTHGNVVAHEDQTVANMVEGIVTSPAFTQRSHEDILLSVIQDLTLHEFGHFLGLGHQFKSNIIPEEGTVPSKVITKLKELATKEKNFSNFTSVMDYRNPRVEAMTPIGHMRPGAHDKLVLRYLYKGEYSTYNKKTDAFKYFVVGKDGVIPNVTQFNGQMLPTAYFPACNDYEASYSADPYCNRFDRGATALDIVEGYFENVRDNLTTSLYAFSDAKGKNASQAEANLWHRSLSNFSRVRIFYDEMRRYMSTAPHLSTLWNQLIKNENSLHEFSKSCQKENVSEISSEILQEMMKDEKLKDLCLANLKVLNEIKTLISLPDADYPLIDFKNRYIQGGYLAGEAHADFGKFYGTWYQMANFPLKASALYTLTTASPYVVFGRMYPNPFYDHPSDRYLYMMLYPREYTQIISDTVKYNLRFGGTSASGATTIGKSVLSLSWMLPMQKRISNDFARFPGNFVKMLSIQTKFELSYAYVIVTNVDPEGEDAARPRQIKRFTGTAWEPRANRNINLTDVYMLPQGDILARANNAFLFPLTKLRFFSDKDSYVVALKADFDVPVGDRLNEDSVKQSLSATHDQIYDDCIKGRNRSGLSAFFDLGNPEFTGFYIPPGIADDSQKQEKMAAFLKSTEEQFTSYEKYAKLKDPSRSMISTCEETQRGVSQLISTSALINGSWVPLIEDHLVK